MERTTRAVFLKNMRRYATPDSTCFSAMGMARHGTLSSVEFRFRNGGVYRYSGLDTRKAEYFLVGTPSKGGYYNDRVKGQYDMRKVN